MCSAFVAHIFASTNQINMENLISTNKVKVSKSRSTDKTIVKMFGVKMGEIDNSNLIITSKPTELGLNSLINFAHRNSLKLVY